MMKYSLKNTEIYFLIPNLHAGGGEKVTLQIINYLLNRDFNVIVCSNSSVHINAKKKFRFEKILWGRKIETTLKLYKILKNSSSDSIIIPVLTGPIILVGILNIFLKRKVYAYEHSDLIDLYLNTTFIKKIFRYSLLKFSFYGISKFFVVNKYLRNKLSERLYFDINKIYIAKNPFTKFIKLLQSNQVTKRYKDKYTAYIICRFSPEKRIKEAIYYADKSESIDEIIVITDKKESLLTSVGKIKKLRIYHSYSEISNFNPQKSFLLNFSKVESYSLVIAEWLSSNLMVLSVKSENLYKLWSKYGCFFIDEKVDLDMKKIKYFMGKKIRSKKLSLEEVNIDQCVSSLLKK